MVKEQETQSNTIVRMGDALMVDPKTYEQNYALYKAKAKVIMDTVAKGATELQFEMFITQAARYGLDVLAKEAWCINLGQGITTFVGRDGFRKLAQRNPDFQGCVVETVCEGEPFRYDPVRQTIDHTMSFPRGRIVAAYAVVHRKGRLPSIFIADFAEYNKGANAWKTNPSAMIKKVAESNALKMAFGLSMFSYADEMDDAQWIEAREPRAAVGEITDDEVGFETYEAKPLPEPEPQPQPEQKPKSATTKEAAEYLRSLELTTSEMELVDEWKSRCTDRKESWAKLALEARDAGITESLDFFRYFEGESPTHQDPLLEDGEV
jgi:phage recombination protein Bet